MIEGRVYQCTWRRRGKLVVLKCLKPAVEEVSDGDLEQAVEILRAQIMDVTGDGEAFLQFVPPLPERSGKMRIFDPKYYYLEYNDMVDWDRESKRELFSDGVCERCRTGLGRRTDIPRIVTTLPRCDLVGFRKDMNLGFMISERLLGHIQGSLESPVRLVEPTFTGSVRKRLKGKRFYEVDFVPSVEAAVPKAHDGFNKTCSFRCPACQTQSLMFTAKKFRARLSMYVVRSRVEGRVLLLREGRCRTIALDAHLHEKIFKDRKLKGIIAERLVMLDDDEALSPEELGKVKLPPP